MQLRIPGLWPCKLNLANLNHIWPASEIRACLSISTSLFKFKLCVIYVIKSLGSLTIRFLSRLDKLVLKYLNCDTCSIVRLFTTTLDRIILLLVVKTCFRKPSILEVKIFFDSEMCYQCRFFFKTEYCCPMRDLYGKIKCCISSYPLKSIVVFISRHIIPLSLRQLGSYIVLQRDSIFSKFVLQGFYVLLQIFQFYCGKFQSYVDCIWGLKSHQSIT